MPIPDAQAGPPDKHEENQFWSLCPSCGDPGHAFTTPGLTTIIQVCTNCGHCGPNQHYLASRKENQ